MSYNEKWHIDYGYVYFTFDWTWIRDKHFIYEGDKNSGMLLITDEDGVIIKALGYELVEEDDKEQ